MSPRVLPLASGSLYGDGRIAACAGATALVSLLAFETMAVAAAMPAIAGALGGLELYALAFGGMLAASVFGMVLAGASCDRRGPHRATQGGLVLFALGLIVAGSTSSMAGVVAGRIVQGLCAGMLGVTLYVGMAQIVPEALHPKLFASFATAWVLPGLVGPPLAAWLVTTFGWRAVFLAVLAVVALPAALMLPAFARLPRPDLVAGNAGGARERSFWALLGALGVLLLHGAGKPGEAQPAALLFLPGLVMAFIAASRLLPRGSLRADPGLPAVIALRGLLAAAFVCAELFMPLYLTREMHWSLAEAGIGSSAAAVCWSGGSALQARITDPGGRRRGLGVGFGVVAAGVAIVAAQMALALPPWIVVAGWAVAGFGIGLGFPMLSVLTMALSTPAQRGAHASALQLSDALCSSAALAVAGALFNHAGTTARPDGYTQVLILALLLAASGAALSPRAFAPQR